MSAIVVQWDGTKESAMLVKRSLGLAVKVLVEIDTAPQVVKYLDVWGFNKRVRPGDFLVKTPEGMLEVVNEAVVKTLRERQ